MAYVHGCDDKEAAHEQRCAEFSDTVRRAEAEWELAMTENAEPTKKQPRTVRMRLWITIVGAVVILVVGIGLGVAGKPPASTKKQDAAIALWEERALEAEDQVNERKAIMEADIAAADADNAAVAKAESDAKAEAAAEAKAAFDAASAKAAADAAVTAAKDTIDSDGVYEVGVDKNPGKWKTAGTGRSCYYAILRSSATNDIADNNNVTGPATVTINAGQYFESSRCGTWQRVG